MNETFRRFILRELSADGLAAWEHEGVLLPWGSITTTMLTMALGLFGLLLLTQQQLVDAWIGYVPALAPAVPTRAEAVHRHAKRVEDRRGGHRLVPGSVMGCISPGARRPDRKAHTGALSRLVRMHQSKRWIQQRSRGEERWRNA